ncbi:hypothetical protein [Rhodococcus sp. FH8]|jgi:hypothetical protein|uniref:hypothetical protein n=1 Tax=Rhodococcus sp. FH8 TaxID=1761013 RepID=UPI001C4FF10D|nr:hypothetical protein [Rhodococcus sp. FH8]
MFKESGGSSMKRSCFGVVTISLGLLVGGCSDSGGSEPVNGSAVTQEVDTRSFPDSVVLTQNFSTLSPSQQESIRELHDLSFEEFSARPLEARMLYGEWLRENNIDRVSKQIVKQQQMSGKQVLYEATAPSIDNTPQEIDNLRAEYLAVSSYLTDWESGTQAYNVDAAKKMASVQYTSDSNMLPVLDEMLRDPETRGLSVTPSTVIESNQSGIGSIEYTCEMDYADPHGNLLTDYKATWTSFTNIHGEETGAWLLSYGVSYK